MKPFLADLPVHRKLVAVALVVATLALFVALAGQTIFDVWRYRTRATEDAATLASLIAENVAAAVTFEDREAAEQTLSTVRIRSAVTRACIFLETGELFASYARGANLVCPAASPDPDGYLTAAAAVPIMRNGRSWGTFYVERDFTGLRARVALTTLVAAVMLLIAAAFAYLLAQWMTRSISEPIVRLAGAARRVEADPDHGLFDGPLDAPGDRARNDEIGDLVRAFHAMLARMRDATAGLRREIEERKKVEAEREELLRREREASRMKDEFVATVAHELRTPLNPILGWAQIFDAKSPDEETLARGIEVITRNVEAQARIIEDLVDVSRIATGKLHLRPEVIDLRRTIEASVELARDAAEAKGLILDLELPDRGCVVKGDPDRLRQVVGNLLSNAVKFSDRGDRIAVAVRVRGGTCEIEVRDEGVGIAPDVLPHIFDRFRQADSSATRRHGGLGLGLAIVKEVTELHGGSVSADSEGPGRGATFRVRLPAVVAPDGAFGSGDAAGAVDRPRLDGVRVLVVDDNNDALDMLAEVLGEAGARVRTAPSGRAARDAWRAEPADVLLCDLAMPGMDGFQVLAALREDEDGPGRRTPAIAVSAYGSLPDRRRSLEAGFEEHVTKPYRPWDLVEVVKEVLDV